MSTEPGGREARTRVTFFLPVNDSHEQSAVFGIIRYLKRQRTSRVPVTGFTHSQFPDTVYSGYWWAGQWLREGVVLFVVDYGLALDNPQLEQALRRLRQAIARWYEHYGSRQEEIWLIAQRVLRYT